LGGQFLLALAGLSNYSDTDSTAASAKETKAPKSNRVMHTPTQKITVTTERTSTFMVVALHIIALNLTGIKKSSFYANHTAVKRLWRDQIIGNYLE
jgi:hypothetical protein